MAKTKGPLLSIAARGQIAKSQVYAYWRGIPYVRRHVDPANPRTTAQTTTRNTFAAVDGMYKRMFALAQAPWKAAEKGRPFTARNALMSSNIPVLRGEADLANWIGSPGVAGGLPLTDFTAVGGVASGEIDATASVPQEPIDWTLDSVTFTAQPDRDPAVMPTAFMDEAEVLVAPYEHTFTGLTAGADYAVTAWPVWTRSDGFTAYGPSSTVIATATA